MIGPGLGGSDPGPTPRTAQRFATELHTLLVAADISGPYVLVGHSSGGFTVRVYTSQYPSEVVGMVLVDAGHEDQLTHAGVSPLYGRGHSTPALRTDCVMVRRDTSGWELGLDTDRWELCGPGIPRGAGKD